MEEGRGESRFRRLDEPSQPDPSDPAFARWRRSLSLLTGLGLQGEDKEAWKEARLMKRCEKWRDSITEQSTSTSLVHLIEAHRTRTGPLVRFMLQHVAALPVPNSSGPGQELEERDPTPHLPLPILCSPCRPIPSSGLFSPQLSPSTGGAIRLCGDYLRNKRHLEDTLGHELIHAWDWRRFDVDHSDPRAVACTEVRSFPLIPSSLLDSPLSTTKIRAALLSGDCRMTRELDRHHFSFAGQRKACARRRAILSVKGYPKMSADGVAERAVDEVWDSCSRDTRPFDEIY